MNDIYKNTEKYNPNKKHKILVVFADTFSNKRCGPIVTELFIRGKKLNNSLVLTYLILLYKKILV